MTGVAGALQGLGVLAAVTALVLGRFATARRTATPGTIPTAGVDAATRVRARGTAEPRAAGARRPPPPVAGYPKRAASEPQPREAPPAPAVGPLRAGPRWAVNAVVAAEVFGPPVALRDGGTLGPPRAL